MATNKSATTYEVESKELSDQDALQKAINAHDHDYYGYCEVKIRKLKEEEREIKCNKCNGKLIKKKVTTEKEKNSIGNTRCYVDGKFCQSRKNAKFVYWQCENAQKDLDAKRQDAYGNEEEIKGDQGSESRENGDENTNQHLVLCKNCLPKESKIIVSEDEQIVPKCEFSCCKKSKFISKHKFWLSSRDGKDSFQRCSFHNSVRLIHEYIEKNL